MENKTKITFLAIISILTILLGLLYFIQKNKIKELESDYSHYYDKSIDLQDKITELESKLRDNLEKVSDLQAELDNCENEKRRINWDTNLSHDELSHYGIKEYLEDAKIDPVTAFEKYSHYLDQKKN